MCLSVIDGLVYSKLESLGESRDLKPRSKIIESMRNVNYTLSNIFRTDFLCVTNVLIACTPD